MAVRFGGESEYPICGLCHRDLVFVDCTECDGEGWVLGVGVESGHGCDGTDEVCAVTCPIPVQVQTQEECEACGGAGWAAWCRVHGHGAPIARRPVLVLSSEKL